VKTRKKLRAKYLDPKKNYRRLDNITDLAALRVITYYEDEVDRVAEVIKREFEIDPANSVDKRETEPDRFGYYALNYVCRHSQKRAVDVEYKKFAGVRCEIQITSILRHAWSEIQHDWYDLRDAFPDDIKRRFARMAALLEIAESEFLEIRKKKTDYERSVALQVEAKVGNLPLDAVSLKSFVAQDSLVAETDHAVAKLLGRLLTDEIVDNQIDWFSRIANHAGLSTLKELRDSLKRYEKGISEYVRRCCHLWDLQFQSNDRLARGASILYLSMLLIVAGDERRFLAIIEDLGIKVPNPDRILTERGIAKEILAKYTT